MIYREEPFYRCRPELCRKGLSFHCRASTGSAGQKNSARPVRPDETGWCLLPLPAFTACQQADICPIGFLYIFLILKLYGKPA